MRLSRVEQPAAHEQVARDLVTYLPHQDRRNQRRYEADAHFGIAELRFRHGEGEVAHRRDTRSSGYGRAVHGGDSRFREIIETAEELRHAPRISKILLIGLAHQRLQLVQVHARAKGFATSGEYGNQHVAFFDRIEGRQDFIDHAKADGVALLGTIEGNGHDPGVLRDLESLEFHALMGTGDYTEHRVIGVSADSRRRRQPNVQMARSRDGHRPIYMSLRRIMSSACCDANPRTRARSPGNWRFTTSVPFSAASAWKTNPTGFSAVPPVGPATPVMPNPSVVPQRLRMPSASAFATASLTAP